MQFVSSGALPNYAAEPVQREPSAEEDPETVGWGSTTVGTLLKAKVGNSCLLLLDSYGCSHCSIALPSLFSPGKRIK